jgi:MFS family permease
MSDRPRGAAHSHGADPVSIARTHPGDDPAQRILAYGTGFVYAFALGTIISFLPPYAADRGLSPPLVGLLLCTYWVGRVAASFTVGRLSDRWGRRAHLIPGVLATGMAAAVVGASGGAALLFLGTLVLGLATGSCAPACIGLIADHTPPARRGTAMGIFECSCGTSWVVAGLLGGQAADAFGGKAPYALAAALASAWTVVLAAGLIRHVPRAGADARVGLSERT